MYAGLQGDFALRDRGVPRKLSKRHGTDLTSASFQVSKNARSPTVVAGSNTESNQKERSVLKQLPSRFFLFGGGGSGAYEPIDLAVKIFGLAPKFFLQVYRDIDRISAMKTRGINQIHTHV